MKYTQLGGTGLSVSRICLGCMSYGTPEWRPWVLDEAAARPFFRRAVEAGINFFDTADMYSRGVSEEVTGRALREYARMDEVVLATKVFFPVREGPNGSGLSRKHIVQACEDSLRRLGVDAIDLYQIHRFDPATPIDETLAALDHLVRQGKVRYLGASSGYAWQLAMALSASERSGWARFVSMQNHYNLLYREEEREMIPLCRAQGLGVIPWSPLARGALARGADAFGKLDATVRAGNDDFAGRLYDAPGDADVVRVLQTVADARGAAPAEVALAWLLAKPGVTAPIVGATREHHLETAIRAVELELTAEEMAALEAPYQPHAVRGH
ncbi:MAG: L-fuco-beta-pyranose dehydrogenase [Gemmatimonadetes bacterium]|nr:L-fuco-beta-pyranose dehydrogenase [Gemmatimonadota bacterium]